MPLLLLVILLDNSLILKEVLTLPTKDVLFSYTIECCQFCRNKISLRRSNKPVLFASLRLSWFLMNAFQCNKLTKFIQFCLRNVMLSSLENQLLKPWTWLLVTNKVLSSSLILEIWSNNLLPWWAMLIVQLDWLLLKSFWPSYKDTQIKWALLLKIFKRTSFNSLTRMISKLPNTVSLVLISWLECALTIPKKLSKQPLPCVKVSKFKDMLLSTILNNSSPLPSSPRLSTWTSLLL